MHGAMRACGCSWVDKRTADLHTCRGSFVRLLCKRHKVWAAGTAAGAGLRPPLTDGIFLCRISGRWGRSASPGPGRRGNGGGRGPDREAPALAARRWRKRHQAARWLRPPLQPARQTERDQREHSGGHAAAERDEGTGGSRGSWQACKRGAGAPPGGGPKPCPGRPPDDRILDYPLNVSAHTIERAAEGLERRSRLNLPKQDLVPQYSH